MESLREKYASSKMLLLITHDDNYEDGADCSGQTVLLDAMASGMPIIASRKSYILEYIVEGKDALLVDFYAPQQIVNAILLLKGDNERSSELGYNAQRSAEENFSTKHMARDLVSLWDKIK